MSCLTFPDMFIKFHPWVIELSCGQKDIKKSNERITSLSNDHIELYIRGVIKTEYKTVYKRTIRTKIECFNSNCPSKNILSFTLERYEKIYKIG